MGTDVHVIFETRQADGSWVPTFQRKPHSHWWYDTIADDLTSSVEEYKELKARLSLLTEEEILAQYGDHPELVWDYGLPSGPPDRNGYRECAITDRDYEWFEKIANPQERGLAFWVARGVPEDISPIVREFIDKWEGDGHTHSWLMVREILNQKVKLDDFPQYDWLVQHIADPDNTRMVFFFDC